MFLRAMRKAKNMAPGRDGIRYMGWHAGGVKAATILLSVLWELLSGVTPPSR